MGFQPVSSKLKQIKNDGQDAHPTKKAMPMNQSQLRQALNELNGERNAHFALTGMVEAASVLTIAKAMLIPEETDKLVKVTDGQSVYIIEAERIAYIRIGL